jgi:hypothetical protein
MSESTDLPVRSATGLAFASMASPSTADGVANLGQENKQVRILCRLGVLFIVLSAIKVLLLVSQGQSLYEAHWRTNGTQASWLNYAAFYGFIVLGGLSLVQLGNRHRAIGTTRLHALNGTVLILGLGFILLTFHNGDKNYFYPILSGVLKWTSLGPYIANSLFFNQPFLAAWVFLYGGFYYVLVRTGRAGWSIWMTAGFGCAYGLLYLRELMVHRDELLIIDCFGALAVLWAWRIGGRKRSSSIGFSGAWLVLPLCWTLFFCWAVLRFDSEWHGNAATYFIDLLGLTFSLFVMATVWLRSRGNLSAWTCFVSFFLVAFVLLTNTNYAAAENYDHLLCLALTFPRYLVGELFLGTIIGCGVWLYRLVRPGTALWGMDVVCFGAIVIAAIDLRLSQIMGVRLGWDVLSFGDSPKMMWKLASPYLPMVAAGLLLVGAAYVLAIRGIQNRRALYNLISARQRTAVHEALPSCEELEPRSPWSAWWYIAAVFVGLGLLGLSIAESDKAEGQAVGRFVRSSPLWKRVSGRTMNREEFLKRAKVLGLGDFSAGQSAGPVQPPRDLNVVIVFMESSYNKHLSLFGSGDETQPLLTKYKDRMELFPNFFSAFAGSIHARFATFTSLYPVSDFHAFTQERVPVKSLFEVLHDAGYSCSMFYSSYFDYTGFRDFLKNRGLDEMYDADTMPGQRKSERVEWGLLEEETLGAIRNQIQKYAQNRQRFCLTYVPAAPHYPYDKIPKPFRKFKMKEVDDFTPVYLNELLYMDWVLVSIIEQLKTSGLLDHTLVVITNDHGEMTGGKDGHVGHGWAMTPELANTPLIIMDPAQPGFAVNNTIGTQVDFLPTLLDRLHIPEPSGQLYQGQSLDLGQRRQTRLGYVNTYKEFAIVEGDKICLGDRERNNPSGNEARSVFAISNQGSKTLFTEVSASDPHPDRLTTISQFDSFQESLLRNYAYYCATVRGVEQPQVKPSQK